MRCASCDGESPAGARFCMHCAAPLARCCAGCAAELPPAARFCPQCAHPVDGTPARPVAPARPAAPSHLAERIRRTRSALEGERKEVTVLFADVKGSMELAEALDAEAWSAVMQGFFRILADGVERFEGFVDKFTGDGIMALFGAPLAHEDHAQRACWAALHLRDEVRRYADELRRTHGLSFAARIGLNSGTVIVGRIGDDLRMEYTAQGHTVGLAQRMEALAEPGTICIAENTRRLVEGWFQLRGLGGVTVKGSRAPVQAAVLEGVGTLRTRLDASRARGFSRFVGRARETAALEDDLASALDGRGRVAGVVGDAGVGKSRLCHEFLETCRARGVAVWQAHCPAHARTIPMLPILELTRSFFGIVAADTPAEARRKVAGTLALLDPGFRDDIPLAFDLLQIAVPEHPLEPQGPEEHRQRLLGFIRRLFAARSAQQPAVLFLDDVHWIDPASDAFLGELVDVAAATRTLLLLNFRPEYAAPWMDRPAYRCVPLGPLGDAEIEALLQGLLGDDPSVVPLRRRLRERSLGNPFFAEEMVLALVESRALTGAPGACRLVGAAADAQLPPTVQGILAARIDRLGDDAKETLQAAAVIGREFGVAVLQRVVGTDDATLAAALDDLQRAGMVHETALYPVAEYAFSHPLTQEVAWRSQLQEQRARRHAAAAAALEAEAGERLDEQAPLIAHHLESAGDAVAAAPWHARVARRSAMRDAAAAIHHWRRVRALLAGVETEDAIHRRTEACREILFTSWRTATDAAEWSAVYEEGLALARRSGDTRSVVMLLSNAALQRALTGEYRAQVALLEEALALATGLGDFALEASLLQRVGWAWALVGDNHRTLEWTERGLRFCARDPRNAGRVSGFDTLAWLHHQHGTALLVAGRIDEAERALAQAQAMAAEVGDEFTRSAARGMRFQAAWMRCDEAAMETWATFSEASPTVSRAFELLDAGHLQRYRGDHAAAIATIEVAADEIRALGPIARAANDLGTYATLAGAHAEAGDRHRARALLAEVHTALAAMPERRGSPWLLRALIEALLAMDDASDRDAAGSLIAALLASAHERGNALFAPFALQYRATAAARRGDAPAARDDLREAARLFRGVGCTVRARELEGRLGAPD